MSDVIKLLPDHIANQIAAGEVIQRPASVIKELVENAIDAGATKIDVLIKDAGKTLIQIVDNGKGMSALDAQMCFARHATSKVEKASDLFHLSTKGFRGEALASISAISHVSLKTKVESEELGNLIQIEGSKVTKKEVITCPTGSSFEVKNLFFNVPARRNFLKSENVEFRHILDEFERIVLAHPEINFSITHNETIVYKLQEAILKKRIVDILGTKSKERLVPIDEETDIVSIKGFVGKPEFSKKKRGEQFLFVNNRFFKDSFFNHAITKAFDGLLPPKTFPTYFLYLDVDPEKIDVNVHPTKTEIKFEEDKLIYAILLSSIRQALGKYNIAPTLDFNRETSFDIPHEMKTQTPVEPTIKVDETYNPFNSTSSKPSGNSSYKSNGYTPAMKAAAGFGNNDVNPNDWKEFYNIKEEETEIEEEELSLEVEENTNKDYILKGNFIFTAGKTGLITIQHKRASERVTYDRLMKAFVSEPIASQKLLFPFEKEVSSKELSEWTNNKTMLERLGFEAEIASDNLSITAVPSILQEENINQCIDTILENIAYREIEKGDIAHVIISSIAFAASLRKNSLQNKEAIEKLIEDLFACTEHTFTPNGKKIIETISLEEINNKF